METSFAVGKWACFVLKMLSKLFSCTFSLSMISHERCPACRMTYFRVIVTFCAQCQSPTASSRWIDDV